MGKKLLSIAASLVVLGACSGDNRFTGPVAGGESPPRVVAVTLPESVSRNDVLRLEVTATSREGITDLDIVLSEGMVRDTTLTFDPPDLDLDAIAEFTVPETATIGSTIRATVTVTDRLGETSEAVEAEVPVVEDEDGGA